MNTGRRFIGMEQLPEYFDIACERIERAVEPAPDQQPDLPQLAKV